jgi:non-specific serine/threonine protein kinase
MASDRRLALADFVRRMRLRAGLTQEELAERAGLTPNTVGVLERGLRRRIYPHTARALADALGLTEAERAELTALASGRAIGTADTPPSGVPPPSGTASGDLPEGLTSFVGRERELTAAGLLVAQGVRLLTLTGTGGVGKSRLAVEAARTLGRHFPDGVRLVELARLAEPALVPQAVATVLGVRDAPDRTFTKGIVAVLREQTTLLVLDNCEHLLDACSALISTVLRDCPRVTVVATSREPLHLTGEQVYPVPPLALPPADWEPDHAEPAAVAALAEFAAVALFVDRARAVRPDFAVTATTAGAVAAICRRLDGLPLAIELAAARVRVLPPEAIAGRLDDRFRLVTGGVRDALARHQTLRALIDWSHDLLSAGEQMLLRRLSVFVGGCTLEATESAAAGDGIEPDDVLDLLEALVDKSLVVAELRPNGARYRLLETVREYAAEQLAASGEAIVLRARHRDWFLTWAEGLDNGPNQDINHAAVPLVMEEFDNLRAAFEWSLAGEGNAALALRIASALWWFWPYEVYLSEGRSWYARALAAAGDREPGLRARVHRSAAALAFLVQDYETGMTAGHQALALARETDDPIATITALRGLGLNSLSLGDAPGARAYLEEALALARTHGARRRLPYVLESLGFACYNLGLGEEGRRHLVEAIEVARAEDIGIVVASGHLYMGFCWMLDGEVAKARENCLMGLAVATELGHQTNMAFQIVALALVAGLERDAVRAARLIGVWQALSGRLGVKPPPPLRVAIEDRVEKLRATLGDETFKALIAEGRALPLAEAVEYALNPMPVDSLKK